MSEPDDLDLYEMLEAERAKVQRLTEALHWVELWAEELRYDHLSLLRIAREALATDADQHVSL